MYAFSVALAANKLTVELLPPGQSPFIAQLPVDEALGNAHAFHYTQVCRGGGRGWANYEGVLLQGLQALPRACVARAPACCCLPLPVVFTPRAP